MPAPDAVISLVERFERNHEQYHSSKYNETQVRHDKMGSLVERMLELHKQSPKTPQEQEMVKREIESTDREIDQLVYELYGLSEDERKIVEEK